MKIWKRRESSGTYAGDHNVKECGFNDQISIITHYYARPEIINFGRNNGQMRRNRMKAPDAENSRGKHQNTRKRNPKCYVSLKQANLRKWPPLFIDEECTDCARANDFYWRETEIRIFGPNEPKFLDSSASSHLWITLVTAEAMVLVQTVSLNFRLLEFSERTVRFAWRKQLIIAFLSQAGCAIFILEFGSSEIREFGLRFVSSVWDSRVQSLQCVVQTLLLIRAVFDLRSFVILEVALGICKEIKRIEN